MIEAWDKAIAAQRAVRAALAEGARSKANPDDTARAQIPALRELVAGLKAEGTALPVIAELGDTFNEVITLLDHLSAQVKSLREQTAAKHGAK